MAIQKRQSTYGAHLPDLPSWVAVGAAKQEAEQKMYEAAALRFEDFRGGRGEHRSESPVYCCERLDRILGRSPEAKARLEEIKKGLGS